MSAYRIPFNRPCLLGSELENVAEAIASGHISGDGPATRRCQRLLERELGVKRAFLTTSCTDALEMAALLLRIDRDDEVIVPSFTFVSTANAFVLHGARPVFVDIRRDTLNIDESLVEERISERTRAILAVHYGGVACEMDTILSIADRNGIAVIEDNAHGLFGRYKGKHLGTLGRLATQSFHETKNFSCGEGGALLVNDSSYLARAEVLWQKGTDRTRFLRGEVDKYTWVDVGSSFGLSDILAAVLYGQLEARALVLERRSQAWHSYMDGLDAWAEEHGVGLPVVPAYCDQTFHLFYLLLPSFATRTRLIDHLKNRGILSVFHYLPLHRSPMANRLGLPSQPCPVTDDVSDRLLRLPLYNDLSPTEQEEVIAAVMEFDRW